MVYGHVTHQEDRGCQKNDTTENFTYIGQDEDNTVLTPDVHRRQHSTGAY